LNFCVSENANVYHYHAEFKNKEGELEELLYENRWKTAFATRGEEFLFEPTGNTTFN